MKENILFDVSNIEIQYPFSNESLFYEMNIPIYKNDVVLIVGDSGIGKSTFFYLLRGIIPNYIKANLKGKIIYENENILQKYPETLEKKIGYLGQNPYSQIVCANVIDELVFGMENYLFSRSEINSLSVTYADMFNLIDKLEQKTSYLSGGECQRLNLASILAYLPEIILLDEPTSFLDNQAIDIFYSNIAKLVGKKTILIIEHNIDKVLEFTNKVLYLKYEDANRKNMPNMDILINRKIDELFFGKIKRVVEDANRVDFYHGEEKNRKCVISTSLDFLYKSEKKTKDQKKFLDFNNINNIEINKAKAEVYIEKLSFKYQDSKGPIFNIETFTAKSGQIIGIIGENGSGKSTLLGCISGILKSKDEKRDSIRIFIDRKKVSKFYRYVSVLFQNSESLFFFPSIQEELLSEFKKWKKNIEKQKYYSEFLLYCDEYFFPLKRYLKKSGYSLSEGEKRRLAFMIIKLMEKPIRLYDEPTYAQDKISIDLMEKMLKEEKRLNTLQIIVSHDHDFLYRLADEIYEIKDKKLIKR